MIKTPISGHDAEVSEVDRDARHGEGCDHDGHEAFRSAHGVRCRP
jgi:hypothetical protein